MTSIAQPLLQEPDQILHLESLLFHSTLELRVARRCRALLLGAEDLSNTDIGMKLDMHRNAIRDIRTRFQKIGMACVEDAPRADKRPKGMSRWSTPSLANRLKLSKNYVHGVLKEHDLHPHRLRTFDFSPHHQFEEKLLEVLGLYMNPPENAQVLCMD